MTTIVIGVDNHATALEACSRALSLARATEAQVHLVCAIDVRDPLARETAQRHAQGLLESISLSTARPVEVHAIMGAAHEAILSVARSTNADLIVVGNKGLTRRGRFTHETPAEVLRHAKCSVLVVDTTTSTSER